MSPFEAQRSILSLSFVFGSLRSVHGEDFYSSEPRNVVLSLVVSLMLYSLRIIVAYAPRCLLLCLTPLPAIRTQFQSPGIILRTY
jgi:hypothetical protein